MAVTSRSWQAGVQLQQRNSLRFPCLARWHAQAQDAAAVSAALVEAKRRGVEVWVLGEGSNVVLPEELDGLVLGPADRRIEVLDDDGERLRVRAGAGVHWDALVRWSAGQGLWGVENLALIPGSVGAAPVQNIGAYGQELATSCRRVEAVARATASPVQLEAEDCGFGYRDSRFRRDPHAWVVTAVELELKRRGCAQISYPGVVDALATERGVNDASQATPLDMVEAITALRRRKLPDPEVLPNAGSFFKNPVVTRAQFDALETRHGDMPGTFVDEGVKLSAAWLIERCGWRGLRRGAVGVADAHALVLVHHGGGVGAELLDLARDIAASVRERFGVRLEQEPVALQRARGAGLPADS
ncbi:MAG: UDP-N-acetylmuramate dehydrogenase [Gammaproteobacteria bacterium]|nr:UDP-N-acetylmuramate dehydrogenase [Gammaproteobacteria bacterium]